MPISRAPKPATLAAALADSPAGLAAWIGEKALAWSSVRDDGGTAFDRELLLGTLTLYWATNTIGSSRLRSPSSAANGSRFPSRLKRWWPGTSTWFDGPNTTGADTSRGRRTGPTRRCPARHLPSLAMTVAGKNTRRSCWAKPY
jgi:hypothetical protein